MFNHFMDWVRLVLGTTYQYSSGMWVDNPGLNGFSICTVQQMGGPRPDVDDRKQRYRVIILGPRNMREAIGQLQADIESLALAALGDSKPCGTASVQAIGEPVGPGYTSENRAWWSCDFEVLF